VGLVTRLIAGIVGLVTRLTAEQSWSHGSTLVRHNRIFFSLPNCTDWLTGSSSSLLRAYRGALPGKKWTDL